MNLPNLRVIVGALLVCVSSQSVWAQMITGHRGASFDAPENTMAAFNLSWEQGADAIEGDFYLTSDKQIVCIHDADTLRTTGIKKIVAESTLAELQKLDAGSWKDSRFRGEPMPTFAEVLKSLPAGKKFVIELKIGPEIVPVLAKDLSEIKHDPSSLLIIAFNADTIAACKKAFPAIESHWLTSFKKPKDGGPKTPSAKQIVATVKRTGADGVGMQGDRDVIDKDFIAQLAVGGVADFHVWTIDSPDDAKYFQQLGARGITTNRPALIRRSLGLD